MWSWINHEMYSSLFFFLFFSLKKKNSILWQSVLKDDFLEADCRATVSSCIKATKENISGSCYCHKGRTWGRRRSPFRKSRIYKLRIFTDLPFWSNFDPNVSFLKLIQNWSLTYYHPIFKKGGYSFWNINRLWIRDKAENQHQMLVTTQYYKYANLWWKSLHVIDSSLKTIVGIQTMQMISCMERKYK